LNSRITLATFLAPLAFFICLGTVLDSCSWTSMASAS
jgi:hypothetical protein